MGAGREGAIRGQAQATVRAGEQFGRAWTALRHDPSVQFNLSPVPAPSKPPAWLVELGRIIAKMLRPVGRFLEWLFGFLPDAAYARVLMWMVIGLGGAALLWALYDRLRHGEWRLRLPRVATATENAEEDWAPEEAGAQSWLDEADALARDGRYAEAIHHLLFRSIDDIAKRRPALVRPALTSRELSASEGIPGRARDLFAGIARLVERSLFGGSSVGENDWLEARETYSHFVLPAAWRA